MLSATPRLPAGAYPLASPAELEVWALGPQEAARGRSDVSPLDAHERRRAAGIVAGADRAAYVGIHVLLRQLLSERLGQPASTIKFGRESCLLCGGPHGRPVLDARKGCALHFSLARSGASALVAIATAPVGVDLEVLPSPTTIDAVRPLLHPLEQFDIGCEASAGRKARFARIWTRKEAYLKGLGVGIASGLAADCVVGAEGPPGWTVLDLPAPPGCAAAAAVAA